MTNEYMAAIAENNVAIHKFWAAQSEYRSGKIGDEEFLAAKAEYNKAMAIFDVAFAKESNLGGE
jgi:hypothetical protein